MLCSGMIKLLRKTSPGPQQDVSSSFIMSGISLTAAYLTGVPSIMLGSILLVGGIIGLITQATMRVGLTGPLQERSPLYGLCLASVARGANVNSFVYKQRNGPRRVVLRPFQIRSAGYRGLRFSLP